LNDLLLRQDELIHTRGENRQKQICLNRSDLF